MFDWIVSIMGTAGPAGVAFLMLLENVFPPIPSELVMPLAGFSAARGDMTLWAAILAGTGGSVGGAWLWYWAGARLGEDRLKRLAERHGRWLTLTPDEIDRADEWFRRHGRIAVLVGRLVPGVRTLISVPAGLSKMPLGAFLLYSSIGSLIWTGILAGAGYLLEGEYERVSHWLNPVSNVAVVVLVLIYLWRVVTFDRRKRSS
ncbi:membrane protein DedA with SNARE-associated domain [Hasllibacter halocynthiae]|uniref:Membrane protein DedA with SNARE-associated domain n=1 Tax=Hasllibacter halocynthiae TaxID=595589 RepID=A0A2T0X9Y9_9RHOB|nr:DedA family protein [Hasllibacter halocynthiae]PRY95760.1 membrane protein DedA with SNARE-associated domain [Hasllibacter halocynthiae]